MDLSPIQFLIGVSAVILLITVIDRIRVLRHRRMIQGLGRQWQMHFASHDRLRLAARIADKIPVAGAAHVTVRDLLFRSDGADHEYLFTVEYGVGVVRGRLHGIRVAGFREAVTRGGRSVEVRAAITFAPVGLESGQAYGHVREALAAGMKTL